MSDEVRIVPISQATAEGNDPRFFQAADPHNALKADVDRRSNVEYRSGGLRVAAHLYRPLDLGAGSKTPAIVIPGPISSVKEETVPHYAERFADAGYTVLTFDPRHLGASEGEPRGHYDPNLVIEDTLNALRYLRTRKDIDASNLALVGVCFGGGVAISAAAQDPLVKTVSSIVGGYDIGGSFQMLMGAKKFADYYKQIAHLVQHEYETHRVAYVPTVVRAQSPETPVAFMAGEEAYTYYQRYANNGGAQRWNPQTTAAGLIPYFAYSAVAHVKLVAPRPVQIIHGTRDLFCFPDFAQAVYDAAAGPRELVWIDAHNHIEFYDQDPYVSQACDAAIAFLEPLVGIGTSA